MCAPVSIYEKLGLKPIPAEILGLKLEEANELRGPIGPRKKSYFVGNSVLQTSSHILVPRNHYRHCLAWVYGALVCEETQPE